MATQLSKVSILSIKVLLLDITKFTQALYNDKDYPDKEKDYESIKRRVYEMSNIIYSYENPAMNIPELARNIDDPKYNPIEVFNKVILPVYKSGTVFESINDPDDKVFEKIKESIEEHTLRESTITLELYPKWRKCITIDYSDYLFNSGNGDIGFPIKGLSGNLQVLLFEKYISRIFPDGNIYIYTREECRYGYPEKITYLAFKDSSDIIVDDYDPEEDEDYPEPYVNTKDDISIRVANAVYDIMKNTTVYYVFNRYTVPW